MPAKQRIDVIALSSVHGLEISLRKEAGARNVPILYALRQIQVGDLHLRVLLQRKLNCLFQRQLQRINVLPSRAPKAKEHGEDQEDERAKDGVFGATRSIRISSLFPAAARDFFDDRFGHKSGSDQLCPLAVNLCE